jgi:hypothetical protein
VSWTGAANIARSRAMLKLVFGPGAGDHDNANTSPSTAPYAQHLHHIARLRDMLVACGFEELDAARRSGGHSHHRQHSPYAQMRASWPRFDDAARAQAAHLIATIPATIAAEVQAMEHYRGGNVIATLRFHVSINICVQKRMELGEWLIYLLSS